MGITEDVDVDVTSAIRELPDAQRTAVRSFLDLIVRRTCSDPTSRCKNFADMAWSKCTRADVADAMVRHGVSRGTVELLRAVARVSLRGAIDRQLHVMRRVRATLDPVGVKRARIEG